MNGSDRRATTACPWIAARDSLYTRVVGPDLEITDEQRSPGASGPVEPNGRVLALVRLHGHPFGLVNAIGAPGDRAGRRRVPVAAAHRQPSAHSAPVTTRTRAPTAPSMRRPGPPSAEQTGS